MEDYTITQEYDRCYIVRDNDDNIVFRTNDRGIACKIVKIQRAINSARKSMSGSITGLLEAKAILLEEPWIK